MTFNDPEELRDAFVGPPDARFRPIAAWWWSGEKLDEDRLLWQLDRIRELGCGGFAVTGLARYGAAGGSVADDPLSFSDEWFELYRMVLERGRESGLSGVGWSLFSPGVPVDVPRLLERRPELRGELVRTRGGVQLQPYGIDFGNPNALDAMLAPGTIGYDNVDQVGDLLGDAIRLMFEDEIIAFPRWSPTFAAEFREQKGYDAPIAAFDQDIGPTTPAVRYDLFDVATTRVERAYTRRMADFVAEHRLLAGYDQMSRRGTPILASLYHLDPFRTMTWANAPGMDQMGDARFHLSVADLTGASRVWLEGFHSHGWGMTLAHQMRLLYEWGREGANLYLSHGMYYSGRAFWWEWAPPEMGWKQPYARHYPAFAAACGRLMMALSAGRHVPEVAVLYPLSTVWADTTDHLEWGDDAWLAEHTYNAIFGLHAAPSGQEPERPEQPSVLAEAFYDRVVVDEAHVDTYDVPIVVPACRCLRRVTVEKLLGAATAGGLVVLVRPVPEWSAELGRDDREFRALVDRLLEVAVVVDTPEQVPTVLPAPRLEGLKSQWRRVGDLDLVLVTGNGVARLRGLAQRRPQRWDVRTGSVETLAANVDGDDLMIECEGPATLLGLPVGAPEPSREERLTELALPEVWSCEYLEWGENRWGDYRLPANEGTPPVERRTFAHREGEDPAWRSAPVTPEDVQHPLVDLGFEDRMAQVRSRPDPADRPLGDGWREVVSTYGPKATVGGRLAEYSERLGVEDIVLSTPLGLKGWVEPVKVDLGEGGGGEIVSYGYVDAAADSHLVVEGEGVLTIWLDGTRLIGPVEGGVVSLPVQLTRGWHEVRIDAEFRGGGERGYQGYTSGPRTRLAWAFTEPYAREVRTIWGGPMVHPDYKGSQIARRFRRRITVPEPAQARCDVVATGPWTVELPEVLEPGEHVLEAFVGGSVQTGGFTCAVELVMSSGTVRFGTDDRWETMAAGEEWRAATPIGMTGALGSVEIDARFQPPNRRSPLLDVAWLEGPDSVSGHVESVWSDAPEDPPPSWFCFTAPPGAREMTLPITGQVEAWADGAQREITGERLVIHEGERVALRVDAPAGHRGAACFREHPLLELGSGTIRTGLSWHRQGLDCFSGVILHRASVDAPAGSAILDLEDVAGSVSIRINGRDAGTLFAPPWRLPVELVDGSNTIELEVANTLGPMAARGVPTPFGPEDQRFSGILGRPRLLVRG
ncbi:MAG: hypothetical protein KY437_00645 [Actinobacteria bacterium]|nr:hypothetical protein [Actinomycetota bacterium]